MRTWEDYKVHVKNIDPESSILIEEMTAVAEIIGSIVKQRNELNISQRDLADITGLSQSTIARIESFKITPKLDTVLLLMSKLGMRLTVQK